MQTIKLEAPWTYRTVEKTIEFPAGENEVDDDIAAAAEAAGVLAKPKEDVNHGEADRAPAVRKASPADPGKE